jgi:hypothetical protein
LAIAAAGIGRADRDGCLSTFSPWFRPFFARTRGERQAWRVIGVTKDAHRREFQCACALAACAALVSPSGEAVARCSQHGAGARIERGVGVPGQPLHPTLNPAGSTGGASLIDAPRTPAPAVPRPSRQRGTPQPESKWHASSHDHTSLSSYNGRAVCSVSFPALRRLLRYSEVDGRVQLDDKRPTRRRTGVGPGSSRVGGGFTNEQTHRYEIG